jgi:hypothetical protein
MISGVTHPCLNLYEGRDFSEWFIFNAFLRLFASTVYEYEATNPSQGTAAAAACTRIKEYAISK